MSTSTAPDTLRPLERRVLALQEEGVDREEIARRFRRSPEFIDRVIEMAHMPRHAARSATAPRRHALRPIERLLLRWQEEGATFDALAPRFKRSPAHLRRVANLADYKLSHQD
ncbi:MAG TPA: hypothetical protein VG476_14105 [Acidimicrobiales bacterium]|nr:hypothetical protein [Acidimicrobiales bacterium]